MKTVGKYNRKLQVKKGKFSSPERVFQRPDASPSVLIKKNASLYWQNQKLLRQKAKWKCINQELRHEIELMNKKGIHVTSKVINKVKDQKRAIPPETVVKITSNVTPLHYQSVHFSHE